MGCGYAGAISQSRNISGWQKKSNKKENDIGIPSTFRIRQCDFAVLNVDGPDF
jgi:hypothetical protein